MQKPTFGIAISLIFLCVLVGAGYAIAAPEAQTQGSITFISGGVGETELQQIKGAMTEYPLELLFAAKSVPNRYLSDIGVQIKGANKRTVLETRAQGPFLLVKLPAGSYTIVAENDGVKQQQTVRITSGKKQRAMFVWSVPVDK